MLQLPKSPIQLKGELTGLKAKTEYEIRVYEHGNLSGGSCEKLGSKFNPLTTEEDEAKKSGAHWGAWGSEISLEHFDTSGEIDMIKTDANGTVSVYQDKFLQNLIDDEPEDELIGRSLALYEMGDDHRLACCVISHDRYR